MAMGPICCQNPEQQLVQEADHLEAETTRAGRAQLRWQEDIKRRAGLDWIRKTSIYGHGSIWRSPLPRSRRKILNMLLLNVFFKETALFSMLMCSFFEIEIIFSMDASPQIATDQRHKD